MVNEMQSNNRTKPNTLHGAGASSFRRMSGLPFLAAWAFLALLLFPTPALSSPPVLVSALELTPDQGQQVLTVSLSRQPDTVYSFELESPARLVLDISPARLPGARRDLPADHPLIFGIRAAQFSRQTVRVVLDLKRDAAHLIASRPAMGEQADHQILVSLFSTAAAETLPPGDPACSVQPPQQAPAQQSQSPGPAMPTALASASGQSPAKRIILFGDAQADPDKPEQAAAAALGRMEISGFAMLKAAQELRESGGEQPRMFRNTIRVEGKWTLPSSTANIGTVPGATNTFLLASAQSDYLWFGPDPTRDDYDLELYEGYLFRGTPGWDLRLGRQAVRWGKADQISPVDNVNAQDLREFLLPDLEDRKIPNWMARVRLFPGDFTLEGVFLPFFEPDRFDYSGTKWALFGIEQPGFSIRENKPSRNLGHADWGLRTATTVAGWDVAASYLYAWEKSPRLRFDPAAPLGPALLADYHRQHIVGLEFETTLGRFGLRGEGAYFDKQSLHTQALDSLAKPVAHYVLGVDYLGEQDWYANIQFSHQHVFAYEPGILLHGRDDCFLNGEINREFWRGNIMLKLGWAVDLADGGFFLTPEAILTYFKNLELSLGANVFSGPEDSLFGQYRDNDQVFLRAKYFF